MALMVIDQLTKAFGSTKAVDQISFDIKEGRCVTLLGPNGAGKTTTLRMLAGLLVPTQGKVEFQNEAGQNQDIRKHIGYLPQYPAFHGWMTGFEFLYWAAQLSGVSSVEAKQLSPEILKLVGLEDAARRRVSGYSGGMKQRLGLAQALIHKPKLLILDEPVSALDPIGRREVLDLLKQLKQHTTIIFSTHVLHDAEEITDDILIMHRGKIVVAGEREIIVRERQRSIIIIQGEDHAEMDKWAQQMKDHVDVKAVQIGEDNARVEVEVANLAAGKQHLLEELVRHNIAIRSFQVKQTTLEDLFLEVVK